MNDDDMEDMKDNFLHSLMKNMSDGMVSDVKAKNTPVVDVVVSHGGADPEEPEMDPEDADEDEQVEELTDMLRTSRKPTHRNNW